ncbi:hypothetical protein V2J09_021124 [Rumex salicifolius]
MNVDPPASSTTTKIPSPYDLNSSDTPGNIITQVQLKGPNYDEWSRDMCTSLRARRKWGFVNGTIKTSAADSPQLEEWWTIHSLIVSWIRNIIEPTLRSSIPYKENAQELWEEIHDRFSVSNVPKIQQLKSALVDTKQRGMPMVTYYGKLRGLWEELGQYDPTPMCTCLKYTCDVNSRLAQRDSAAQVHQFLMGLDTDAYGIIRSTLLATENLPLLNKMALISNASNPPRPPRSDNPDRNTTCTHCNRRGHAASGCFKLIGYPDWWPNRKRNDSKSSGPTDQSIDRSGGGASRGRGRGNQARANAAQSYHAPGTGGMNLESEARTIPRLSGEQLQSLHNFLTTQQSASSSEHMTATSTENLPSTESEDNGVQQPPLPAVDHPPQGRGHRVRQAPAKLRDYVTNSAITKPSATSHSNSGPINHTKKNMVLNAAETSLADLRDR